MNSDCKLKQKTKHLTKMEFDIFIDEKDLSLNRYIYSLVGRSNQFYRNHLSANKLYVLEKNIGIRDLQLKD